MTIVSQSYFYSETEHEFKGAHNFIEKMKYILLKCYGKT